MKKIIACLAVVFFSLVLLPSCTKNSAADLASTPKLIPDRTISARVSPGQIYTVTIDHTGELSISRQALHFATSEAVIDPKNNALIYNYVPAAGFTGNDEVVLAHKREYIHTNTVSNSCYGDSQGMLSSKTSFITIKITVAQ